MRSAITAAVAVAVVTLAGCSSYDSVTQRIAQSITPYRITVVQGNFVSQEKASQLQAGMTRDQVRALLGTPLLADLFHADRWDYLFYFKRGSTSVVQQRDLVLNFQNDRFKPSAQTAPSAPTPGGLPPGASPAIQPQFQFQRPPQPPAPSDATPPVGPQGSDVLPNQPLTAPPADISAPPNSN